MPDTRRFQNEHGNIEINFENRHHHRPDPANIGGPGKDIEVYRVMLTTNGHPWGPTSEHAYLNGVTRDALFLLYEALSGVLGRYPSGYAESGNPAGVIPAEPAPDQTLMKRTARKIWLQQRLREYSAEWKQVSDFNKGLRLDHDNMVATVIKYEGDIFHWVIAENTNVPTVGAILSEGMVIGITEGMIEASEELIKRLDALAADANKRLTAGKDKDGA